MTIEQKKLEALKANENNQPAVSMTAIALEGDAHASGRYGLICTGPLEQYIKEYAEIRDAKWAAEKVGNFVKALEFEVALAKIPTERKWQEPVANLVTTVGGNNMLDNHLSGSGYTAAWYILLISSASYTTGPAAGDTMASHGGWTESTAYANSTRVATSWSAAAAKSKSLSAGAVFNINATDTLKGCGLVSNSTKGGTTGTLFSAGLFTGGDQPVVNTNTLTVSYTGTV